MDVCHFAGYEDAAFLLLLLVTCQRPQCCGGIDGPLSEILYLRLDRLSSMIIYS